MTSEKELQLWNTLLTLAAQHAASRYELWVLKGVPPLEAEELALKMLRMTLHAVEPEVQEAYEDAFMALTHFSRTHGRAEPGPLRD